jgi:hypothetical protein
VFTVTRQSDGTTANTGAITVTVPAHVPTAAEIAAGIASVTAPATDATSLTLPSVPSGYGIAIFSSSNTSVIGTNGVIVPPTLPTNVNLVFTVTRQSDGTTANTSAIEVAVPARSPEGLPGYTYCASEGGLCSFTGYANVAYGANDHYNYGTFLSSTPCDNGVFGDPIGGVVKACYFKLITPASIAAGITNMTAPDPNATSLALPEVPSGYSIAIASSSNTVVISTYGVIAPPSAATDVDLVLTVTRISDGTTANTNTITVSVPAYVIPSARTGINAALAANGGTASASSSILPGFPVTSINDGDIRGVNWGNGGGWNDADSNVFPDWVQIEFNESRAIHEIDVFTIQDMFGSPSEPTTSMTFSSYGIVDFTVEYWNGSSWVTVTNGNVTGNNLVWRQFSFSPVTTDKIRVMVTKAADGFCRIIEVEAWTGTLSKG